MSKAVAVGEKHLLLGFKGVGFEIVPLEDASKLMQELVALSRDPEVGFVLVTESMAGENPQAVKEFRQRSSAILAVIPTHEGSRHVSFEEIRKSVERSMGVDILGKDTNSDEQGYGI
jgi:V/A-type H+/Na+-transporting ATPase subunit F